MVNFKHILLDNKNFLTFKKSIDLKNKNKSIMITGGSSINFFFKKIVLSNKKKINAKFYLTDERIYSKKLSESNSFKILKILEKSKKLIKFYPINSEPENIKNEIKRYDKILPNKIDHLFLSLGKKKHFASLFLNMQNKNYTKKLSLVKSPSFKYKRITVTKNYISSAKNIYIFVFGLDKANLFIDLIKKNQLNCFFSKKKQKNLLWILDKFAYKRLKGKYKCAV